MIKTAFNENIYFNILFIYFFLLIFTFYNFKGHFISLVLYKYDLILLFISK